MHPRPYIYCFNCFLIVCSILLDSILCHIFIAFANDATNSNNLIIYVCDIIAIYRNERGGFNVLLVEIFNLNAKARRTVYTLQARLNVV